MLLNDPFNAFSVHFDSLPAPAARRVSAFLQAATARRFFWAGERSDRSCTFVAGREAFAVEVGDAADSRVADVRLLVGAVTTMSTQVYHGITTTTIRVTQTKLR